MKPVALFLLDTTDNSLKSAAQLLSSHFKGEYTSLGALQTAHPTASPGDYANVNAGVGTDVQRALWDDDDSTWVLGGTGGAPGDSAYTVAVNNGFPGTEPEWLDSLKGADGADGADGNSAYELFVAAGFVGDEADWRASLQGTDGVDGVDGDSAYTLAVQQGFGGTVTEWLGSLKADLDGAEIKTRYEGEADTNAFTDAEKTKLAGIASGATSVAALNDLSDVTIAGPAGGEVIAWHAGIGDFRNQTLSEAGIAPATHEHNLSEINGAGPLAAMSSVSGTEIQNGVVSLGKLQDMASQHFYGRNTAGNGTPEHVDAATARAILNVEDGATAITALSAIADVNIDGPATGELLTYDANSDKWVNQTSGQLGLATSAQGAKADTALQPANIASGTITARADDIDFSGGNQNDVLTVQPNGSLAPSIPNLRHTVTWGATTTFDLHKSNNQRVVLIGNTTLALSNVTTGQKILIEVEQGVGGSHTVTWWSGITWGNDNTPPTLETTAGKQNTFAFICTGSGTYRGYVIE